MSSVVAVEAGADVVAPSGDDPNVSVTWVATESCGGNGGHWFCVTHGEAFSNNLMKDGHISRGEHVLAWYCTEHFLYEAP